MANGKVTFEEFKRRYNAQTEPTVDLSAEDPVKQILEHEKRVRGIDWLRARDEGPEAVRAAVAKAQSWLDEKVRNLSDRDREAAKTMGILNARGQTINLSEIFFDTSTDQTPATFPDDAPSYFIWGWSPERVARYQAARGETIKTEIQRLVKNFQAMEGSDDVGMTRQCMMMGIYGFTSPGLSECEDTFEAADVIDDTAIAFAVFAGIILVGVVLISITIALVIIAVLIPFFIVPILMSKPAQGLFVIINKTASDLVLNGIHFSHGKCVTGFTNNADKDQAIIPAVDTRTNGKATMTTISAGFLGVSKRDSALIGTRGAVGFAATKEYPAGIDLGWEVPLSQGLNKLLVSATYTKSLSDFSDETGESGVLNSESTSSAEHKVEGNMNNKHGSEAFAFFIAN